MTEEMSEQEPNPSAEEQREKVAPKTSGVSVRVKRTIRSRVAQAIAFLFLLLLCLLTWHFIGDKSNQAATKPRAEIVPVEIAPATQKDVPIEIKSIANVE